MIIFSKLNVQVLVELDSSTDGPYSCSTAPTTSPYTLGGTSIDSSAPFSKNFIIY